LEEGLWIRLFCKKGRDNIEHVRECREMKEWFTEMGLEEKEILKNLWGREI